jgi:hypothetical protein
MIIAIAKIHDRWGTGFSEPPERWYSVRGQCTRQSADKPRQLEPELPVFIERLFNEAKTLGNGYNQS